ncbi:MAG: alpha-ribazole phosphatase family protein [Gammaproteobacteria bacterium]
MDIHLLRHTRTLVPAGICYGRTDVELPEDWVRSAAPIVARLPVAVRASATVYSSPLSRCARMAALLERKTRSDNRLAELDFGDWEMRAWRDLPRAQIEAWNADLLDAVPYGGESVRAMYARSAELLDELCASGAQHVVAFSHGGPIRCMIAHALGVSPAHIMRLHLDFGAASLLRRAGGVWKLVYLNR